MAAINDYTADRAEQAAVRLEKRLDDPHPLHHSDAMSACAYLQACALIAIAHASEQIASQLATIAERLEDWAHDGVPMKGPHSGKK